MSDEVRPFTIHAADSVLDDLRERLARTIWPDQIPGSGWGYGTDREYLQRLCEYWADGFDWRAQEARFNRWPNFLTEIDGQQIHFIHARSPEPDALPLVITHGWPGSVAEFLDVVDPLCDPRAHGGDPADAFHVVAPSLPGYGWSGPTVEPGWDVRRVAEAWVALMARLGYDRYGAQGGDWGAMVSMNVAALDPEHVAGLHTNMLLAFPTEDPAPLSDDEMADVAAAGEFMNTGSAYQQIQGKNPQTLGYGLTDSPAGLAGWITEKHWAWTHHPDGDLEDALSMDQQLTNITLYWVTRTINSSIRLYCESMRTERFGGIGEYISVPTGALVCPGEIFRAPRPWAEQVCNLVHYTRADRGGHFAAWEEPEMFVDDVRAFFRLVR
jgi:pimeloyl-ACP methyl ester carboxylesterase